MTLMTNTVRRLGLMLLIASQGVAVMTVCAGEVVVSRSSEPFDAFAVRDRVLKDFEWQESLRHQHQLQILQALPLGCVAVITPYRYFRCGESLYRPYRDRQREVYIRVDPPKE